MFTSSLFAFIPAALDIRKLIPPLGRTKVTMVTMVAMLTRVTMVAMVTMVTMVTMVAGVTRMTRWTKVTTMLTWGSCPDFRVTRWEIFSQKSPVGNMI